MSDALNPRARAFLRSVQGGDDPTRADRDRVRARVKAQLAAGIAAGVAALATSKAAASTMPAAAAASTAIGTSATAATTATTATVAATTAASVAPGAFATVGSGFALGKLATALLIVGAVAGGTTAVVRHVQPDSAPHVPAAGNPVVARPPAAPRPAMPSAPLPVTPRLQAPPALGVPDPGMAPVAAPGPAPAGAVPTLPRSDRSSTNVSPAPLPVPAAVPATPAAPSLDDEISLVRDARAALRGGDPGQALALLDEHDRRFPAGALAEDCAAARIYALCALGRTEPARSLASRFLSEHPVSPHAASVRNSCGVGGGAN